MLTEGTSQAIVERAERLRSEQRAAQRRPELIALVTFRLGHEAYGVAAQQVRGVIPRQPIVRIPSTPAHLLGVTNFRGEILPTFDLKVLLGLAQTPSEPQYLVIARPGNDSAALGCDSCPDIVQIAAEDIKPPSSTTGSTAAPYLAGHVVARQGTIAVLDVDRVLQC